MKKIKGFFKLLVETIKAYKLIGLIAIAALVIGVSLAITSTIIVATHDSTIQYKEEWFYDSTHHWKEPVLDDPDYSIKDKAFHTYGDWVITKEPTEDTKGVKKHACIFCGYEESTEIDMLDHVHVFGEWKIEKQPTEEETGLRVRTCYKNDAKEEEIIPKLPHVHTYSTTWSTDSINHWHQATCGHDLRIDEEEHNMTHFEFDGNSRTKYCTVCGYEISEVVEASFNIILELNAEKTGYLVKGIKEGDSLTIPDFYDGLPVISIEKDAFKDNKELKTVVIGGNVLTIKEGAFSGCDALENILYIGNKEKFDNIVIFEGNDNLDLTNKYLFSQSKPTAEETYWHFEGNNPVLWHVASQGLEYIPNYDEDNNIISYDVKIGDATDKDIIIPEKYKNIDVVCIATEGFKNTDIDSLTILGSKLKKINDRAFESSKIKELIGYSNVEDLGEEVFKDSGIISFILPSFINQIGDGLFKNAKDLNKISLNNVIDKINYSMFEGCSSLKNITIPENVKSIEEKAFKSSGIENLTIPSWLENIGANAFEESNLKTLILPKEIKEYAHDVFKNINNLNTVTYLGNLKDWLNIDFENEYSNPMSSGKEFRLANDNAISSIVFDNEINLIKAYTFYGFNELISLDLTSVKIIGKKAFANTTALNNIILRYSIEDIDKEAFSGSNITNIKYDGTKEEFNNVSINELDLSNITITYLHGPKDILSYDEEYHWYDCIDSNCKRHNKFFNYEEHDHLTEVIKENTTYTKDGILRHICECGHEYETIIPKLSVLEFVKNTDKLKKVKM